ncbi:ABC transporter permease [Salipiger marinus]|uniref:Peptide/nickel transport system permease protein n=1 Tax=Salipiger marinus TaxID=555512 RepID=A0A1G8M3J1_9RHOB|nr:ABC transporter permease [Salipiger marinus]SDI62514.1 peptide/nickel transport system permease protein [Salipiger marinus]
MASTPDITPQGATASVLSWLRRDLRAALCLGYLLALVIASVAAPLIAQHSPIEQSMDMLAPPSGAHWLGTDDLGRDVFARMVYGAPMSLYASMVAVGVGLALGLPTGMLAGYLGGRVDTVISRIIDTLLAFPGIILAVAVTGALGIGLTNAMIAVGIVFAPNIARLIRIQTIVVKNELYVDAARSFGMPVRGIILRHIVPNAIQPIIVQVTVMLAGALLAEASLSFLGLGVQPPWPSWGQMLARGYTYMEIAPEQMYAPGIAILLTALAYNGLGESLRTRLDPTSRSRR